MVNNFVDTKDYVNNASKLLKSNLEKMSENGTFDVYSNGFYLSQMLISCIIILFKLFLNYLFKISK